MKKAIIIFTQIILILTVKTAIAQTAVEDIAVIHQEERMVYLSWDQGSFDPQPDKFFGIPTNPYWWIIWGFPNPNYHKNDLRPLKANGPETQRLALEGLQNQTDNQYKLHSDTLRNTAISEILANTGVLSDADPLWILYYSDSFQPVLNNDLHAIVSGLSGDVIAELYKENMLDWYMNELALLKERLNALRSTTLDRGSRIMGYYQMLKEYKVLAGQWTNRVAAAQNSLLMAKAALAVKNQIITIGLWTPGSDLAIANQVINSH